MTLGEGRLVGVSDWSLTPRSLDAVRARWVARRVRGRGSRCDPFAARGRSHPSTLVRQGSEREGGTGAELYALTLRAGISIPSAGRGLTGLARIAQTRFPTIRAPATHSHGTRACTANWGDNYSAEGAYEVGRVGIPGGHRPLSAWGRPRGSTGKPAGCFAESALSGSYASGSGGPANEELHRLDPLLPDSRSGLGQMGLYAWSNIIEGAFTVRSAPTDELMITLGYRHVRLADSRGAWFSASLSRSGRTARTARRFWGTSLDAAHHVLAARRALDQRRIRCLHNGRGARAILESGAGCCRRRSCKSDSPFRRTGLASLKSTVRRAGSTSRATTHCRRHHHARLTHRGARVVAIDRAFSQPVRHEDLEIRILGRISAS